MAERNEAMVFYRSFEEAIREIEDDEAQLRLYRAIISYGLSGETPELKGVELAIFKLIKPQIDANNQRRQNGRKGSKFGALGGRPKNPKETPNKPQENPKETPNKPQENPKKTPKEKEKEKEKEKVKVNDKEKENEKEKIPPAPVKKAYGIFNNVYLADEERDALLEDFSATQAEEMIENLSEYMQSSGKRYQDHYATIRKWAREDAEKKREVKPPRSTPRQGSKEDLDEFYKMIHRMTEEEARKQEDTT